MKHLREFPFERARRITAKEVATYRKAIETKLEMPRRPRGRPPKSGSEKYHAVSMRLHPKVLAWARAQAKKLGLGYQTIINRALLKFAT